MRMQILLKVTFVLIAVLLSSSVLVSCFESSSEQAPPQPPPPIIDPGVAYNGKVYFQQNCSYCHAAGSDDITTAYGAIDLANQQSLISSDLSQKDQVYFTMGRFDNIDQERVNDLKKYLSGL